MHLVLFTGGWQGGGGGVLRKRGSLLTTMRAFSSGIDSKSSSLGERRECKRQEDKWKLAKDTVENTYTNMHVWNTGYSYLFPVWEDGESCKLAPMSLSTFDEKPNRCLLLELGAAANLESAAPSKRLVREKERRRKKKIKGNQCKIKLHYVIQTEFWQNKQLKIWPHSKAPPPKHVRVCCIRTQSSEKWSEHTLGPNVYRQ